MNEIRQKIQNYLKSFISKKGYDDDLVDTNIDLETNDEEYRIYTRQRKSKNMIQNKKIRNG